MQVETLPRPFEYMFGAGVITASFRDSEIAWRRLIRKKAFDEEYTRHRKQSSWTKNIINVLKNADFLNFNLSVFGMNTSNPGANIAHFFFSRFWLCLCYLLKNLFPVYDVCGGGLIYAEIDTISRIRDCNVS